MPLFGTLSTMPLTDLLQWLGSARQTGTLQIERDKVSKAIVFHDGQVIGCSSDDPPQRLGQFLITQGKISEEQLRHALMIKESTGKHLGMTLVEMGALSPAELSSHLEAKAEETIFSLFDWEDAVFRFQHGIRDEANVFPISLRVEDVLLRGLKRFDEIQRIREVLYDARIVLRRTDKRPPEAVLRNAMARSLFDTVDGDRTLAEIRLHVHGSEYVVHKFLFELYQNGYVTVAGIKKIEPVSPGVPHAPVVAPPPPAAAIDRPPGAAVDHRPSVPKPSAAGSAPAERPAPPPTDRPAAEPRPSATRETHVFADVEIPTELESADESEAYQLTRKLEGARGHMRKGEFEAALVILEHVSSQYPGDESLRRLTAEAESAFIDKAYRYYFAPSKIPRLTRPIESMATDAMSPTEFFLLSRIDGSWNVKSIVQVAPLREADTLRALKRMREQGLIELQDAEGSGD
ncbi:MAG TPA: DUF4388 domain-containing protein [Candidatus Polarisedimenticolaceae bacterium]|nr:DUF4388 domain-containing protein [Candidatus Polarisedimenticolaceae bacterium]